MTTILAYKDGMYADSRCTDAGTAYRCDKIFIVGDQIVGCSGVVSLINTYLARLRSVGDPTKVMPADKRAAADDGDPDFAGLVLSSKGLFSILGDFGCDAVRQPYHAIGSGRKAALAAVETMRLIGGTASIDPVRAIEVACRVDVYSAPPVHRALLGKLEVEWL